MGYNIDIGNIAHLVCKILLIWPHFYSQIKTKHFTQLFVMHWNIFYYQNTKLNVYKVKKGPKNTILVIKFG